MLPDKQTSASRHVIDAFDAAAGSAAFDVSDTYLSHSCDRAKRDVCCPRRASEYWKSKGKVAEFNVVWRVVSHPVKRKISIILNCLVN